MKIIITVLIITFIYLFGMTKLEYYRESNLITLTSKNDATSSSKSSKFTSSSSSTIKIEEFKVLIEGEVLNPTSYLIKEGETVEHLIALAGGLSEDADLDSINLYYNLTVEDKTIYIPPKNNGNKISINNADVETLSILGPITETLANEIIKYREVYGEFLIIDHIMRVKGIKEKTFEKLRNYITL